MSGGHFDYQQYRLLDIAEQIDELIASNEDEGKNSWGDPIGRFYTKETVERFREAAHTLRLAEKMAQRVDWLVSGDDGENSFHTRWNEEVETGQDDYKQELEDWVEMLVSWMKRNNSDLYGNRAPDSVKVWTIFAEQYGAVARGITDWVWKKRRGRSS